MQAGTVLDFQIRLRGIPIRWQSRIQSWEPPREFVDVQTRGPYRSWEHIHTFLEQDGGTLCRDEVRYTVWGGTLVDVLFVRRELRRIFAYRTAQLTRLLPATSEVSLTPNPPVSSRYQNAAAPFCAQVPA
jgi:ligand-binding SRPBCC domain-containing protein